MKSKMKNTLIRAFFALALLPGLCACAANALQPVNSRAGGTAVGSPKLSLIRQVELADQAYARGEWVAAEQHYQRVTRKAPNDYYAWFRMGNARLQQANIEGAIQAYHAAVQRDTQQAKPYYNLATAYLLQAQRALQQSDVRLSEADPGRIVIAQRLKELSSIVYTPVEDVTSPTAGLIEQPMWTERVIR